PYNREASDKPLYLNNRKNIDYKSKKTPVLSLRTTFVVLPFGCDWSVASR
ncbi:hypothetical protein LCGC14_3077000, partial [marine sediment metagenome]